MKVYSDDKDGVDAGELIGREPVGVTASHGLDRVLAIDADCVVYTPRLTVARRGVRDPGQRQERRHDRVPVPSRTAFARRRPRPRSSRPATKGGTTVHGCGLNPGNLSGALPLALIGMSRTIEQGDAAGAGGLVVLRKHARSRSTTCGSVDPSTR